MHFFSLGQARRWRWLSLALALVAFLGQPISTAQESPQISEWWYRVEVDGQRAGWMYIGERVSEGQLIQDQRTVLELRRGALQQKVEMESRFVETIEGEPISARSKQVLGTLPIETSYLYGGAGIEVETRQGDAVTQQRRPHPRGPWLTPGQAQREIERQLAQDVDVFEMRTVDPQFGTQPLEVRWQRQDTGAPRQVAGEPVMVTRWQQTQSLAPQMATFLEFDATGRMVYSSVQMMGIEVTMTQTSKQDALVVAEAPEILLRTFLRPNVVIERPRQVRRGVYNLHFDGGVEGFLDGLPGLNTGIQQVERLGDALQVSVDLSLQGTPTPSAKPVLAGYLTASTFLNYKDPLLQQLGERALHGVGSDSKLRAETLRQYVADYLSDKNLATVMATASEVATRRSGDCTEHSVLLAALLRGDGIPSRVAAGLVYVKRFVGQEDFFGYHMWTQARLGGRWVDLDASMGDAPFDATHIQLAISALDDDKMALMELAQVAPWIGGATIEIVEVSYDDGEE